MFMLLEILPIAPNFLEHLVDKKKKIQVISGCLGCLIYAFAYHDVFCFLLNVTLGLIYNFMIIYI